MECLSPVRIVLLLHWLLTAGGVALGQVHPKDERAVGFPHVRPDARAYLYGLHAVDRDELRHAIRAMTLADPEVSEDRDRLNFVLTCLLDPTLADSAQIGTTLLDARATALERRAAVFCAAWQDGTTSDVMQRILGLPLEGARGASYLSLSRINAAQNAYNLCLLAHRLHGWNDKALRKGLGPYRAGLRWLLDDEQVWQMRMLLLEWAAGTREMPEEDFPFGLRQGWIDLATTYLNQTGDVEFLREILYQIDADAWSRLGLAGCRLRTVLYLLSLMNRSPDVLDLGLSLCEEVRLGLIEDPSCDPHASAGSCIQFLHAHRGSHTVMNYLMPLIDPGRRMALEGLEERMLLSVYADAVSGFDSLYGSRHEALVEGFRRRLEILESARSIEEGPEVRPE